VTPSISHSRTNLLILGLILALAAVLRIQNLSALGFWTDELGAMSASGGWGLDFVRPPLNRIIDQPLRDCTRLADARPVAQIIPGLIRDESHPPIYFLLQRFWRAMFGDSESAVRSLNVLFSLAAIPLLFFASSRSVGVRPALWACLLMAVASPQITFAQEARNYMPGMTFSLLALVCMQRFQARPTTTGGIAFGVSLLAMMLTHYFTAGAGVAMAIFAATTFQGRSRRMVINSFIIAAILFHLLWGIPLWHQLPNFHSNYTWLADTSPGRLQRWLLRLCTVPVGLIADRSWPIAIAGGITLLWLPIAFVRRPELRLWILWFACSLGLIAGLDLVRSTTLLTLPRYLLFATPAAYVLIAAAIPGRGNWIAPSVAIIAAIFALRSAYIPDWKIDDRTPVQLLARRLRPTDGLVISGPDAVADAVLFGACQHYMPKLPRTCAVLTAPPNATVLERLRQCPRVGVIWLWPDRSIRGFDIQDQGSVPYMGTILIGSYRSPASSR
jgi:uncharacterized membrane protein